MKNSKILKMFQQTFLQMNIKQNEIEEARNEMLLPPISVAEFQDLQTGGINIKNLEAFVKDFPSPKPFTYKERPVFLYIHDQYKFKKEFLEKPDYDKFHLCYCNALKKAERNNRFANRYVVTCRKTGTFPVIVRAKENGSEILQEETLVKLRVCRNCLAEINWEGKASEIQQKLNTYYENNDKRFWRYNNQLKMMAINFNLEKYLKMQGNKIIRAKREETRGLDLLTKNALVTKQYGALTPRDKMFLKKAAKYSCQVCGKKMPPEQLQIHHMNHNQGDNSSKNLKVVCKNCHKAIHEAEGGVMEND